MSNSNNTCTVCIQPCTPSSVEPLTFTINELAAALQLIRDQDEIFQAHNNTTAELPSPHTNGCTACIFRAHRQQCYACCAKIPKVSEPEPQLDTTARTPTTQNDGSSISTAIVVD
ncbi:hypothetical protein DEU56DRAFT_913427 [Suillus clintonianus]|uniref:uncharacterized protein n=1 Tax=Suillus clintonianus TaxID=1904413 RepID=UPI001B85EB10|nr:uncharacterized protein DEU56DRAFT_913427 [Suillus clintonianus]KAG2135322.1 hypothetical protein DEU56DRAFT_913427 [Suillus clintonianus]